MIILQIILLTLVAWLTLKLLVRFFVIYKSVKNFFTIARRFKNNAQQKNHSSFYSFTNANKNANNRAHKHEHKHANQNNNAYTNTTKNQSNNTKMVECEKCQLYIPIDESYKAYGKYYCCKEHAQN